MRRKLLGTILPLLLVFALLAGCGAPQPSPTATPSPTPTATPTPTSAPPSTAPPVETPAPPSPTSTTYVNGLNGAASDTDPNVARPIAVMFNNISVAMPQCGSGSADILYKVLDEGGITRMMGIFSDISGAGVLGSVRSARPYNIDIAEGYDALYVHAGGSDDAYAKLANDKVNDICGVRGPGADAFYRDPSRQAYGIEHSMFTTDEKVLAAFAKLKYPMEHASGSFDYGLSFYTADQVVSGAPQPPGAYAANSVVIHFGTTSSSKTTTAVLDSASGNYTLKQYKSDFIDGNTKEVQHFDNILVLYAATKVLDSVGRLAVTLTGTGKGYFACGGQGCDITWSREKASGIFKYSNADGSPLYLTPGRTYIAIVPMDSNVTFS